MGMQASGDGSEIADVREQHRDGRGLTAQIGESAPASNLSTTSSATYREKIWRKR